MLINLVRYWSSNPTSAQESVMKEPSKENGMQEDDAFCLRQWLASRGGDDVVPHSNLLQSPRCVGLGFAYS